MLITSRDSGRWVIPKGWPIKGLTPDQAAAREAWEEAGVQGAPLPHCIGLFSYEKIGNRALAVPDSRSCLVAVYPLEVAHLHDDFPEKTQRRRKWFAPAKAARKVAEAELQALLAAFAPPGAVKAAGVRGSHRRVAP